MIWRPSRAARILEDVPLPSDYPEGILVGAFDLSALRELEKWRRLIQTSLPDQALTTLLIADSWPPKRRRLAEAAFSPSDLAAITFVIDEGGWQSLAQGEATFAAVVRENRARILILGGPTDAGWDRLEEAI